MKFSGKIGNGTMNEPLNVGSDPWPWRRFALSECTLLARVCALRVLLVIIICRKRIFPRILFSVVSVVSFLGGDVCMFLCLFVCGHDNS